MERDLRIDSMRGFLLCAIGIEHMGVGISIHFYYLFGLFSFAECLVFMSGLVTGITSVKTYKKYGMGKVTSHVMQRFFGVYLGHIIPALIILGFAAVSATALHYFEPNIKLLALVATGDMSLTEILLYMAALIYQPDYFDIFPMFILLILATPVFVYFLGKNRALALFALSGAVWLAVQLGIGSHWFNDWTINNVPIGGLFNPFAWQLLFLIAFYIGFNLRQGVPPFTRNPAFLALCGVILIAGLTLRYGFLPNGGNSDLLLLSKKNVGIIRLVNVIAFICLVAEFGRRFPTALVYKWFVLLGQHSLQVFSFQIIFTYLSTPIIWRLAEKDPLLENAYVVLFLASLTLPALAHIQYRKWRLPEKKTLAMETSQ